MLPAPGSNCVIRFTYDVLKAPTIDIRPAIQGIQTAQVVEATEQSDIGNGGSGIGTQTPTTVLLANPSIATVASPGIVLGEVRTLSDQATVAIVVASPVGSRRVTFRLYGPNDATCSGTPVFVDANVALTLNGASTVGTAQSANFTPAAAGIYRWRATYNGDANNSTITGACDLPTETRTVTPASPSIATVASPGVVLGAGTLSDQATVSGLVNPVGARR